MDLVWSLEYWNMLSLSMFTPLNENKTWIFLENVMIPDEYHESGSKKVKSEGSWTCIMIFKDPFMLLASMLFKSLFSSQCCVTNITTVCKSIWKMFGLHMIPNIDSASVTKPLTNIAEILLGFWILSNKLQQVCRVLNRIWKQ